MIFKKLKTAGMKWAQSPQAMKLMMDPRFQKVMIKALQVPSDVRNQVVRRTGQFAAYADLVTRSDVQNLNRNLRDLERELRRVKKDLIQEREQHAAAKAALGGNSAEAAPAEKKAVRKKKIAIKRTATPNAATPEETEPPKPKKKIAVKRKVSVKKKGE